MVKTILLASVIALASLACKTPPGQNVVYLIKVEAGDTLSAIAQKYDTTPKAIKELNSIKSMRSVRVGDVLRIQPGPAGRVMGPASATEKTAPKTIRSYSGELFKTTKKRRIVASKDSKLMWPLGGRVTSRYGMRWGKFHQGIDISGARGSKIKTVRGGKVSFAGWQRGYGRVVIVDHKDFKTLYAHCRHLWVKKNQWIQKGRVVGTVGTSGNSRGPHLHFEVRKQNDRTIDPLRWLSPRNKQLISVIEEQVIERTQPYLVLGSEDHLSNLLRL